MTMAGVSWGIYSLRGRRVVDSLADTTTNFVLALPLAAGVTLLALRNFHASPVGILLAILSGALASGIGYVVWYAALKGLTAIQAASVQLSAAALALGTRVEYSPSREERRRFGSVFRSGPRNPRALGGVIAPSASLRVP